MSGTVLSQDWSTPETQEQFFPSVSEEDRGRKGQSKGHLRTSSPKSTSSCDWLQFPVRSYRESKQPIHLKQYNEISSSQHTKQNQLHNSAEPSFSRQPQVQAWRVCEPLSTPSGLLSGKDGKGAAPAEGRAYLRRQWAPFPASESPSLPPRFWRQISTAAFDRPRGFHVTRPPLLRLGALPRPTRVGRTGTKNGGSQTQVRSRGVSVGEEAPPPPRREKRHALSCPGDGDGDGDGAAGGRGAGGGRGEQRGTLQD